MQDEHGNDLLTTALVLLSATMTIHGLVRLNYQHAEVYLHIVGTRVMTHWMN